MKTILRYFRHLFAIISTTVGNVFRTLLLLFLLYAGAFIVGMGFNDGVITSNYLAQPTQSSTWDQIDKDYEAPGKKYVI